MYRQRRPEFGAVDHYIALAGVSVRGATQKDVLEDPDSHKKYIAKLGNRNNDLEVMTEQAIYLVGRTLGVQAATGRIARYRGSLRFLSEYFLDDSKPEELVHGMQLFTQLYDDTQVHQVLGNLEREQDMFCVQAVFDAFGAHYFQHGDVLLRRLAGSFVAMLAHDAIIGVQDRHHENWGLIVDRNVEGAPPRFAPLYDSARGLFCNFPDDRLLSLFVTHPGQHEEQLDRYISRSRPLVGYRGLKPVAPRRFITHDQLVAATFRDFPEHRPQIAAILDRYEWKQVRQAFAEELGTLCSPRRTSLILTCLRRRIRGIWRAIDRAMAGDERCSGL